MVPLNPEVLNQHFTERHYQTSDSVGLHSWQLVIRSQKKTKTQMNNKKDKSSKKGKKRRKYIITPGIGHK